MTISQIKIDLAVLYKLHQHAEAEGDAIPPADISRLFEIEISTHRITLALEALEARQDVDRKYDHFYLDEGAWQISRNGMIKVDRALRVPTTFIARLHANGDEWLESDEAKQAKLNRLPEPTTTPEKVDAPQTVEESSSQTTAKETLPRDKSGVIDWTKWGSIAGIIGLPVAILLWYFS